MLEPHPATAFTDFGVEFWDGKETKTAVGQDKQGLEMVGLGK